MELLLVRHGIAEDQGARFPADFDRPLTSDGRARMVVEGAALRGLWLPDAIITSPLVRARQTAEILARACGIDGISVSDSLAERDFDDVFAAVTKLGVRRVAAVGHEPLLSMTLSIALTGSPGTVRSTFKKGAAALIGFDGDAKAGEGWLEWLLQPAALRALAPA